MDLITASKTMTDYLARLDDMDETIHPNDDMFAKSQKGMEDYKAAGKSTIDLLLKASLFMPRLSFGDILDFGCGHGRVARHFKLAFPDAKLHFSDLDETGWTFCAEQFGGEGFPSVEDLSQLEIPKKYDLIWLGSVFTHLDWDRSVTLLEKLLASLKPNGAIVASFRGRAAYEMMMSNPERFNTGGYYDELFRQFHETGFGYMDYKGFENWGQNLFTPSKLASLSDGIPSGYPVAVIDRGWANIHDIGIWSVR
jgi:SAM-dependent methyltransferase